MHVFCWHLCWALPEPVVAVKCHRCTFLVRGSKMFNISARHIEDPGSGPLRGILRGGSACAGCSVIMLQLACLVPTLGYTPA